MAPSTKQRSVSGTVIATTLVTVPCLVLVFQLMFFVPRTKKTFDEFGLQLPWLTKQVVVVSTWFNDFWWLAIPSLLALLLLTVVGIAWMRHFLRYTATLPTAAILAGHVVLNLIVAFALFLPMVKLQEGLSK